MKSLKVCSLWLITETIMLIVVRWALELKQRGSFLRYYTTTGFLFDLSAKGGSNLVDLGSILAKKFVRLGTNLGKLCIKAGAISITLSNKFGYLNAIGDKLSFHPYKYQVQKRIFFCQNKLIKLFIWTTWNLKDAIQVIKSSQEFLQIFQNPYDRNQLSSFHILQRLKLNELPVLYEHLNHEKQK